MVTRWSRSTSNFYALIGQNLTGEFMRKIYAASWNLFTLTAEADRVLCQLVMFFNVLMIPVHWICNYLPNLLSFLSSGGVDNLPFSVSGLLSFSASWYRALLFPYLLTHLVIYDACFKIWLRRTLNGFLLSGCPGCHLGKENKTLYWTLWVAGSVVKIKALSENLASRNRLLSVDKRG